MARKKNGLRLDRRKDAMRGGTLAVIGPGNAEGSRLYRRLIGSDFGIQMPPTGALPAAQVAILKQWIDEGAEWPDAVAGDIPPTPVDPAAADLNEAIRTGDRGRITSVLAQSASVVKQRGPGGATPLMYAALSDARKTAAFATSQGEPILPVGLSRCRAAICSGLRPGPAASMRQFCTECTSLRRVRARSQATRTMRSIS